MMNSDKKGAALYILNLVFSFIMSFFPLWAMDFGNIKPIFKWIIIFIITFLVISFSFLGQLCTLILWIIEIIQCINGTITGTWAILSYILFAIFIIIGLLPFLPSFSKAGSHKLKTNNYKINKKAKCIIVLSFLLIISIIGNITLGYLYTESQSQYEELQEKYNQLESGSIDWDALSEKVKEKSDIAWEKQKNAEKPDLDVEWR